MGNQEFTVAPDQGRAVEPHVFPVLLHRKADPPVAGCHPGQNLQLSAGSGGDPADAPCRQMYFFAVQPGQQNPPLHSQKKMAFEHFICADPAWRMGHEAGMGNPYLAEEDGAAKCFGRQSLNRMRVSTVTGSSQ